MNFFFDFKRKMYFQNFLYIAVGSTQNPGKLEKFERNDKKSKITSINRSIDRPTDKAIYRIATCGVVCTRLKINHIFLINTISNIFSVFDCLYLVATHHSVMCVVLHRYNKQRSQYLGAVGQGSSIVLRHFLCGTT